MDGVTRALIHAALTALAAGNIEEAQRALRVLVLYCEVP